MVDLEDWVDRPILSDLRRIMQLEEYVGTFAIGDFPSGHYAVASLWLASNSIICDDRSNTENYRGPYCLLSALSNAAVVDHIPFMLCTLEQTSVFNNVCRKQAVAMTTEILSRRFISQRLEKLGNKYDNRHIWHDPRDFSLLLYFGQVHEKLPSQL
ncbi:unnamed protein product [Rotaria sp. Silwood2]|nr:unnamed protein product [Rotaria sp. Silwood2]CAF4290161.1 unnamed protein product [Rotaria sp. Silwood2]CAF4387365.1 unnamed protein product [Rotaria sp. Silwood2]